jgi:4-hydroxy-tetrahydrodipicolinate reductase
MGQAVARVAADRGHEVVTVVSGDRNRAQEGLTTAALGRAEVAIEFTGPGAAPANVRRLIELGLPVVSGTTGWSEQLPAIETLVSERRGALLWASNFSIGAHLLFRMARLAGSVLAGRPELDAAISERHHTRKVDAPSGTALTLQRVLREADPARAYPITSERLGWDPGRHTLTIDGIHETLTVTHAVRDRAVFAGGAVAAAEWLAGRTGVFQFEQVLFGD